MVLSVNLHEINILEFNSSKFYIKRGTFYNKFIKNNKLVSTKAY